MSAPSRGRGGSTTRGATTAFRGRGGNNRGNTSNTTRGRGRGRGGSAAVTTPTTNNAGGLLQKLRTGSISRTSEDGSSTTPRGRGTTTRGQFGSSTRARGSGPKQQQARSAAPSRTSSPAPPASHRDFMAQMNEKFQLLKPRRDAERKKAIQDGFLSDPEKKTSLANAITPVGTCTDMCPEFERVERIVQNMVDKTEKVSNDATGRDTPSEDRMVKRFRRSAAGYDEQLPSDIRTPETLRRTLDYLLDKVIGGGERLATIHKFVWDRTRGIRNDFSIQQVSRKDDVKIAVECYERIARFHILSLHQLSNPDNLQEGEHFDAHQEREQLNNTLLSLMYYYDDNRGGIPLPNEPEFRAYCVLFELQALTPDIEDRMQTWPVDLLNHPKVQTSFKLYAAAGNTIMDQGPLRPWTPFSVAQSNSGKFWTILSSQAVSYIMACVAEMNFSIVRFTALDALWRSAKSAPQGQQVRNQDWTIAELQNYLAFDNEDETSEFCQAFDLAFKISDNGDQCLDFAAASMTALDRSSIPSQQVFSHGIVEEKRYRRTLVAVVNGVGVASAIRQGLVVEASPDGEEERQETSEDDQSMFIPEQSVDTGRKASFGFGSNLNPAATTFAPSSFGDTTMTKMGQQPAFGQGFGANAFPSTQIPLPGPSTPSIIPFQPSVFQVGGGQSAFQPPQQTGAFPGFGLSGGSTKSPFSGFGQIGNMQPSSISTSTLETQPTPSPPIFGQKTSPTEPAKPLQASQSGFSTTQGVQQPSSFSNIFGQNASKLQEQLPQSSQPPQPSNLFNTVPQTTQEETKISANESTNASPFSGFNFTQPVSNSVEQNPQQISSQPLPEAASQQPAEKQSHPVFNFAPTLHSEPRTQAPTDEPVKSPSTVPSQSSSTEVDNPGPAFSFMQPTPSSKDVPSKTQSTTQQTTALPRLEPSTTPQGTPQKKGFKFATVSDEDPAQGEPAEPVRKTKLEQPGRQPSSLFPSQPQATQPVSFIPQAPAQPAQPKFTAGDREKLVENTSRLILTQPQGLIEYFVSHHVSSLLQTLVKEFLQNQRDDVMAYIRTRHLSRKFFAIWHVNTQRSVLNKRTKQRRKLLAAAMQAEMERKQRDEAELEAILIATQETKRLQAEQRHLRNQTNTRDAKELPLPQPRHNDAQNSRVTGQKRKTTSTTGSPQSAAGTPQRVWPSHKRSRTVGTMSEPSASLRPFTAPNNLRTSNSASSNSRFGQSLLGRSTGSTDSRQSLTHKVDSTKTDYFKLKAMGIDPNTPIVPDTAKSLQVRRSQQQEAKEVLLASSRLRPSVLSASTLGPPSPATLPTSKPVIAKGETPRHSLPSSTSTNLRAPPEEDTFLQQLREARQSLAQDADWFKNQTAELEKEIKTQEELRESQNSSASNHTQSPRVSVNGFTKSNGYNYLPPETRSGSRTEERLSRTGTFGLGTRQTIRDYVPVVMSRQSALKYGRTVDDEMSAQKKRKSLESDALVGSGRDTFENEIAVAPAKVSTKETTVHSKGRPDASLAKSSLNAFAALQNDDDDDDDDEDEDAEVDEELGGEEEEYEDEEEDETNGNDQYYHNGTEGDTEDNNDDLFEEEEDDEDDLEDEHHTTTANTHHYPDLHDFPYDNGVYDDEEDDEEDEDEGDEDDDGTPGTYPPFSRAQSGSSTGMQSGPGASVDDAVVLSD